LTHIYVSQNLVRSHTFQFNAL